jgi:phage-related protein
MADENKLQELKTALQQVLDFLGKPEVSTALSKLPASIKKPVLDGLKTVLGVLQKVLDELKGHVGDITTVQDLLKVLNDLLTAAEGLAPGEKATLDNVKKIVQTLQDLPDAAEIGKILDLIQAIITKLGTL